MRCFKDSPPRKRERDPPTQRSQQLHIWASYLGSKKLTFKCPISTWHRRYEWGFAPPMSIFNNHSAECVRKGFFLFFSLALLLQTEIPEEHVPIRNSLKLAQPLGKFCALMKGHAGLSVLWHRDCRGRHLGCCEHYPFQGTGHKTDKLFFPPNGKLPFRDPSILDTKIFIKSCKFITMYKPC